MAVHARVGIDLPPESLHSASLEKPTPIIGEVARVAGDDLIGALPAEQDLHAVFRCQAVDFEPDYPGTRVYRLVLEPEETAQVVPHPPRGDVDGMRLSSRLLSRLSDVRSFIALRAHYGSRLRRGSGIHR